MFRLYDEESIDREEAEWILDKLRDDRIVKNGIRSIENIAIHFEENFFAPSLVERERRINDPMKGIAEIIEDLEEILG